MGSYNFENLCVFHVNIRSLRKHFDEFLVYLSSNSNLIHVIIFSEVWIQANEVNKFHINNYDLLLQERKSNASGGVAIYVHNSISYDYDNLLFDDAEGIYLKLFLEISGKKQNLNIFGFYRNYNYRFHQFFNEVNNILSNTSGPTILVGDLNYCILEKSALTDNFLSMLASLGFISHINEPTRENRCLDHVHIRDSNSLVFQCKLEDFDFTDHKGVFIFCKSIRINVENIEYVKAVDFNLLSRRLADQDWSLVNNCNDINMCLTHFYNTYNLAIEQSSFIKRLNRNNKKRSPWISHFLIKKINSKNNIFKLYKKDRNNRDLENEYRNKSRECSLLIKYEKLNYYSNKIRDCNGDSRRYWKVVKSIMRKEVKRSKEFIVNGKQISVDGNEQEIANAFNKHFTEMPGELISQAFGEDLFEQPELNRFEHECTLSEISAVDLINVIRTMNNKKSVGLDGISIVTIKRNLITLLPSLLHIINLSIATATYPDQLKTSIVVPIYKSDDPKIINHYRPISLQNSISKIFENCIKLQIITHFSKHSLFSLNQYGFIKNKSTDLALERHITEIVNNVDNRKPTLAVYLDFTKAFDLVDLNILLYKLEKYGIRNNSLNLLRSFLTNRKQIVRINGVNSSTLDVGFGVPQGGVLGPILFVIFLNDMLSLKLNSKIYAFADDSSLVCSANNYTILENKINKDLAIVSEWISKNKLIVNTKKSNAVVFSYKTSTIENVKNDLVIKCHLHSCLYSCNCNKLNVVNCVKYLGLKIDSDLRWRSHVDYLVSKLRKINYSLYHMRGFMTSLDLRTLYISWFESTLRYGIIHWGGTFKEILKPVVIIQKFAIRNICNVGKFHSSGELFEFLKVMSLDKIFIYSILMFVRKNSYLFQHVELKRCSRHNDVNMLTFPLYMKDTSRNQCYFKCTELYNKFHSYVNILDTISNFKSKSKKMLENI